MTKGMTAGLVVLGALGWGCASAPLVTRPPAPASPPRVWVAP